MSVTGDVIVQPAEVIVCVLRPANRSVWVPDGTTPVVSVKEPYMATIKLLIAQVGAFVAPVQLMSFPSRGISEVTVCEADTKELASKTITSCGSGTLD